MNFLNLILLILLVTLCIYAVIDRVCKCFENCAHAKAYSTFLEKSSLTVAGINEEKKNEQS